MSEMVRRLYAQGTTANSVGVSVGQSLVSPWDHVLDFSVQLQRHHQGHAVNSVNVSYFTTNNILEADISVNSKGVCMET